MKLHPEDPRLTAYVLGELDPDQAAAVERAAAGDPAIREKIQETRAIQQFLKERLVTSNSQLHAHQRENIRRHAHQADREARVISFKTLQPLLIPAAAAAVLGIGTFILFRMPPDEPAPIVRKTSNPVSSVPEVAKSAPPAPSSPPAPALPAISHPGSVAAKDFPMLELPIQPGKPNLSPITRSILDQGQLPPHEIVRLEEILNSFPLRLNGVSAISRSAANNWHPDNRDSGMSAHVATLSTEMIACPWKPSATLLLISIRANEQKDCDVKIAFHANPENVFRYRLLGFTPVKTPTSENLPTRLPAGTYTTLAIEIEPSQPGTDLGSLEWSTDDKAAPSISLLHKSDAEPSDDARFAALVCTYSQWLAGEQIGIIDPEIVSALARETASATLPKDRADFLRLIDKSLHL